ncbi:hypothetical protein L596_005855 [Steinernema carpocapsae]|uniref:Uncharacterized protein n=1 Tax=Steinernema carpocapsae TaxID=34508 RepID=A0A4U8V4Z0_STECR|nr:hypothetical protein L596_005855 [Steinernema carpocapsae]
MPKQVRLDLLIKAKVSFFRNVLIRQLSSAPMVYSFLAHLWLAELLKSDNVTFAVLDRNLKNSIEAKLKAEKTTEYSTCFSGFAMGIIVIGLISCSMVILF